LKRLKASGGGSDFFSMGKTDIKPYGVDKKISTRFKDVAGQEAAKLEITEFVEFLRKPEKYIYQNP
jgi:ATP-dependent Zn protease